MSADERTALSSLSSRKDIEIQPADEGGKIVVMNHPQNAIKSAISLVVNNVIPILIDPS